MLLAMVEMTSSENEEVSVAKSPAGKLNVSETTACEDEGTDVGVNDSVALRVQTSDAPDRELEKVAEAHAHTAFEKTDDTMFA